MLQARTQRGQSTRTSRIRCANKCGLLSWASAKGVICVARPTRPAPSCISMWWISVMECAGMS